MASVHYEDDRGRKGWKIRFRDAEQRPKVLWLGDVAEHFAQEANSHVEHLVHARQSGLPPSPATTEWLSRIRSDNPKVYDRIAKRELVESRHKIESRQLTIKQWFDEYIAERTDVAANTSKTYREVRQNLVDYFGPNHLLRDVTVGDAKKFRVWMATLSNRRDKNRKTIAESTVRRRTGICKQIWSEAIEREIISDNPFAGLQSANRPNPDRQSFVTHEMAERCIEAAPCGDWRTIIALCRYAGLRCPSEILNLRWSDVDLPGGKMMIDSPKTGLRVCPVFVELRPYLEAAWDYAPDGTEFVINRYRSVKQNLRTTFEKIIKQAGLVPWPRLFQNLRASRETELMAKYPAKDVSSWIGNSVPVAMKHYAMATESTFQHAAGLSGGNIGGNIMGTAGNVTGYHHESKGAFIAGKIPLLMNGDDGRSAVECAREESNLHGI